MSITRTFLRPTVLQLRASRSLRFQSSLVKQTETLEQFQTLIKEPKLTIVDFFATWCGPCKAISPIIEKFSEEYKDVQFLKVDVDESTDIAREYGITAMPTFVLFKNGDAIGKIVGANPAGVKKAIDEYK